MTATLTSTPTLASALASTDNLETLAQEWFLQKAVEDAERAKRIALESRITDLLKAQLPTKGQRTFKAGVYNMTIKTDLSYRLKDKEVYQGLMASGEVPDVFAPVLSDSKINTLVKSGMFAMYSKHFDVNPTKPAFTVVQARI